MKQAVSSAIGLSIVLTLGCAGVQYAEDTSADMGFADWDIDRSGSIARDEFESGFMQNRWFDGFDRNGNGRVTNEELAAVSSARGLDGTDTAGWDTNRDGVLDGGELGRGTFAIWDRNRDGLIDGREFNAGEARFD